MMTLLCLVLTLLLMMLLLSYVVLCVEYWIVSNETNTDVRMYNLFIR